MKVLLYITLLSAIVTQHVQSLWMPDLTTILKQVSHITQLSPINFFVGCTALTIAYSTMPKEWREKVTEKLPTQALKNTANSQVAQKLRRLAQYATGPVLAYMLLHNDWIKNRLV